PFGDDDGGAVVGLGGAEPAGVFEHHVFALLLHLFGGGGFGSALGGIDAAQRQRDHQRVEDQSRDRRREHAFGAALFHAGQSVDPEQQPQNDDQPVDDAHHHQGRARVFLVGQSHLSDAAEEEGDQRRHPRGTRGLLIPVGFVGSRGGTFGRRDVTRHLIPPNAAKQLVLCSTSTSRKP